MLALLSLRSSQGCEGTYVAVEETAHSTTKEGDPDVGSEADHDHAEAGAHASEHQNRLATDPVGEAAPVHAHSRLAQGEGGDEKTGVERGVIFAAETELLCEGPRVGVDACEGYGFGETDDGWRRLLVLGVGAWRRWNEKRRTEEEELKSWEVIGVASAACLAD